MPKTKKKEFSIEPQFIKNDKGKATHVYLTYRDYKFIQDQLKKYEKVKKRGIKWVQVSREK